MEEITVAELVNKIPGAFIPEKSDGVSTTILVNVSGVGGGQWVVQIENKKCAVINGTTAQYDMLIEGTADDALAVFKGSLDPMKAYMQGRVRFTGNMFQAMKLLNLFRIPR